MILIIYIFTIIILCILFYYLFNNYLYCDYSINKEKFCDPYDHLHALLAPNIPDDPKTKFKIGGKYCSTIINENIVPNEGKYKFSIPKFLYDGIWLSNSEINGDIQTQKWKIFNNNDNLTYGYYASNNFTHLPEKPLPPNLSNDLLLPFDNKVC